MSQDAATKTVAVFIVAFGVAAMLVVAVAAGALVSLVWANVLQDLWLWFVVPTFHLPPLPFWTAAGLILIWACFDHKTNTHKDDPEGKWGRLVGAYIGSFVGALIIWGLGALYAGFAQ